MKVFLRNTQTGQYYRGPAEWTRYPSRALDFEQLSRATQLAVASHLKNVEVLLSYDQPDYNIVVPLDTSRHLNIDAGTDE